MDIIMSKHFNFRKIKRCNNYSDTELIETAKLSINCGSVRPSKIKGVNWFRYMNMSFLIDTKSKPMILVTVWKYKEKKMKCRFKIYKK